jgi:hypothetical protein
VSCGGGGDDDFAGRYDDNVLIAVIFLCLSTVLVPMGFDSEIIGGSPFQLPADYRIGSSYVAFVGATLLTVLSALVTGKMCLPRFIA